MVCFEVIEHVEEQERTLDELRRVLTDDGVLAVSSPNPAVYVQGNPHHKRELGPAELEALLAARWNAVRLFQQSNFVSALIQASGEAAADAPRDGALVHHIADAPLDGPTYSLALASDAALPDLPTLATLAAPLEIREWVERFRAQEEHMQRQADALETARRQEEAHRDLARKLADAESELAELPALRANAETLAADPRRARVGAGARGGGPRAGPCRDPGPPELGELAADGAAALREGDQVEAGRGPMTLLSTPVMAAAEWQMHYGERFALEGILATLKPELAIEIGRAEGGSLRRIAAHSGQVHSFDLVAEGEDLRRDLDNVVFHTGDSAAQVPETLKELAAAGRHVDFALVDGDHSAEGVRRDALALLESDACRNTVIVFHDAANDDVRAGLESVRFEEHPKVGLSMLDFVPGFLVEKGVYAMHIWNGLGVVVLDDGRTEPPITEPWRFDAAALQRRVRDLMVAERDGAAPEPAPEPAKAADGGIPKAALAAAAAGGVVAGWLGGRLARR